MGVNHCWSISWSHCWSKCWSNVLINVLIRVLIKVLIYVLINLPLSINLWLIIIIINNFLNRISWQIIRRVFRHGDYFKSNLIYRRVCDGVFHIKSESTSGAINEEFFQFGNNFHVLIDGFYASAQIQPEVIKFDWNHESETQMMPDDDGILQPGKELNSMAKCTCHYDLMRI